MTLSLRRVSFSYAGGPLILDRVSLEVGPGELIVVLGANGSGKTTLTGIASGLLVPESGAVSRQARPRAGSPSPGGEAASSVGGWSLDGGGIGALSRGQSARRLLEGALERSADLIVLDEPTIDLDARGVQAFVEQLGTVRRQGAAVLIATKEVDLGCGLADSVGILDGGSLHVVDPVDALLDEPRLRRLGLRPRAGHPPQVSEMPTGRVGTHRAHAARLASLVRQRLGVAGDVKVLLQQTVVPRLGGGHPITVVSVAEPEAMAWVFECPLCELSPHELRTVLATNPRGHTHVSEH